jgi:hypothetical protein
MLRSMQDLQDYEIGATDGTVGHVRDFYFDDRQWVIRYLVVDTGSWLSSRKVLISPMAIHHADWAAKILPVSISREQVRNSPDIDTDKPVSRQHERDYLGYYGHPYYWGGGGLWGGGYYPGSMPTGMGYGGAEAEFRLSQAQRAREEAEVEREADADPHLRSCQAVIGYRIHASNGEIGHVSGLLVDEETWAIRYVVVDTSNWWLGHKVLIAPQWIKGLRWEDEAVVVDLTRESVKDAPPFDSTAELNREREMGLFAHYGRAGYWPAAVDTGLSASSR